MPSPAAIVVLAAGGSTRMKSKRMKVLHELAGRSLIGHVLSMVGEVGPDRLVVVVGARRDQVMPHVQDLAPDAIFAVQEEQLGTGHAVGVGVAALQEQVAAEGTIVVLSGDSPLIEAATVNRLVALHEADGNAVTVLAGRVPDPTGYGRIVRAPGGGVAAIVEEKDASAEQRLINEVNSGVYAFDASFLAAGLWRLGNDNASGEYYLTDLVGHAVETDHSVGVHVSDDPLELEGVNDRRQLSRLARAVNDRIISRWQGEGVTFIDPATTWVDVDVVLEPDVTILPNVQLHGSTRVGEDAVVGPDCTLRDVEVGAGASVVRAHAIDARIGSHATVGPFAYLRPGTVLADRGKIGGFVETKNAVIGEGAKVPHLTYVGDAEIGEGSNIGAGTIFANYDGVNKHRTKVGKHAHTGSNNVFVAPVEIGDGAATGGGTVVREAVPPGALAVSAGPQRTIEGWVVKRQPGTVQADAASLANRQSDVD